MNGRGNRSLGYWQWRVTLCVMGVYLFYYTGRLVIGHALPLMEKDLGYSNQQLGWLATALLIAYGVGQAINGNLGDRLGGRRMMALGAVVSTILCWTFSFGAGLALLITVWAANGYAQSMGWAPGGRLLSNWWPRRRRGLAFGLYVLAAGFGTVLVWGTSYAVLEFTNPQDPARWRWLFRIPVAGLALAGVVFYMLVRERPEDVGLEPVEPDVSTTPETQSNEGVRRYAHVLGNWKFLLACAVILLQSFSRYGLLTWMVKYYSDSGIELKGSLLITLSLPIGMGLGGFAGGYISDRFFRSRRSIVISLFLGVGALCALMMYANPISPQSSRMLGIAMLFFVGFFVYGAQGPLWALCPDLVGRQNAGTAVGVMDAIAYLGAGLQGPLLGYFIDHPDTLGYPALFLSLSVATGVGALLALAVRR